MSLSLFVSLSPRLDVFVKLIPSLGEVVSLNSSPDRIV